MKYVSEASGAELSGGSPATLVNRVCSDSRLVQKGDLFFAIKGERFDGHDFLAEASARGVAAVVAERGRIPAGLKCAVLTVENTRQALGKLAARYRVGFTLPVIAVAGSNGKTSAKELAAALLRQKFKTLWSEASYNNDIGVPQTLLRLEPGCQAAVLEAGTNHPGELAPLLTMIGPQYGILTSIGREHLEFFGDIEGVAEEEGWIAQVLPPEGRLFINGDDEWASKISRRSAAPVTRAGFGKANDWRAADIRMDSQGTHFKIATAVKGFSGEYRINLLGRHQVVNALLAVAAGAELGLSPDEARAGLAECKPAKMRMQMWDLAGVTVIDDAYNANADSMVAALKTLKELECHGRRVAVLGDMAELGAHGSAAHQEVGRVAAECGVDQLFAIGKLAGVTVEAAQRAGLKGTAIFPGPLEAAEAVGKFLKAGDVLLLKASRSVRMERLAEALKTGMSGVKA